MDETKTGQARQPHGVAALYARAARQVKYEPKGISLDHLSSLLDSITRTQHLIRLLVRGNLPARAKQDRVQAVGRAAVIIDESLKEQDIVDLFASYRPCTDGSLAPWQVEPRKRRRIRLFQRLARWAAGETQAIEATNRELVEARCVETTLRWSDGRPEIEQVVRRAQDVTGLYGSDLPHPEGELARDLVRLWQAFYSQPPGEADFVRFAQECCPAIHLATPSRATLARALRENAPSVAHTVP